jgi:hypothetical protein
MLHSRGRYLSNRREGAGNFAIEDHPLEPFIRNPSFPISPLHVRIGILHMHTAGAVRATSQSPTFEIRDLPE